MCDRVGVLLLVDTFRVKGFQNVWIQAILGNPVSDEFEGRGFLLLRSLRFSAKLFPVYISGIYFPGLLEAVEQRVTNSGLRNQFLHLLDGNLTPLFIATTSEFLRIFCEIFWEISLREILLLLALNITCSSRNRA